VDEGKPLILGKFDWNMDLLTTLIPSRKAGQASKAGAYTRPLLSSIWAVSETKYTLNTP